MREVRANGITWHMLFQEVERVTRNTGKFPPGRGEQQRFQTFVHARPAGKLVYAVVEADTNRDGPSKTCSFLSLNFPVAIRNQRIRDRKMRRQENVPRAREPRYGSE
jgi:hypothetical protein